MEDEQRQKKLEAGKAKLAEYRQRKAHADSQKKQKKKKKKKPGEDSEGDSKERVDVQPDQPVGGEEVSVGGRDGSQGGNKDPPTTEFTFARTLRSGETVKHDQTYTIEPESEVSTTAEDYSSEVNGCHEMTETLMMSSKDFIWEEVEPLKQVTKGGTMQDMEDALAAKTQAVEELSRELEEIRAAFGTEGVQQLQDFEAALKQRDGIITQLTANLQQARKEKDEIMKEFLELTEQSQKLQIQFQQLQAGETLRNTSHSSTASDLLQARQQLMQYQQLQEEMNNEVRKNQERSSEQLEHINQIQHKLSEMEMSGKKSEESFTQRINEKDLLITEQEKVILSQKQSLTELRTTEASFAQTLKEKNQIISEQTAIITEHERSLTLFRDELAHVGKTTDENIIEQPDDKNLIVVELERAISERNSSITQLEDELQSSEKRLHDLQQRVAAKEFELERCLDELESTKSNLESCKSEMESCKLELEKGRTELESCKDELATSRQKERMSSNEIMQLMGTVEDLQKRYHQGSLSESDTIQKMQEDTVRKLEVLRAELDEMYGQQIVQMKHELNLHHASKVEQMTEQHRAELELFKAQSSTVSAAEVDTLNAKIRQLQGTLEQSQAMHNEARHKLTQATQEKVNLQTKVEDLVQDLRSAKEKVELVSNSLISQESQQGELQCLQETIDSLKCQLAAGQEAALEEETKHESEVTNYKIKLEMLEREKDAVLDRMAESQEAELERLRTQLLFSHEEELTHLREELQRESFLNTENLLNEAAVKHERAFDERRIHYEEELHLLRKEKSSFDTERDDFLHQILGLKEDLKLALQSSKADELVQQLQELQVELEELRRRGEQRAGMENEIQTLLKKTEVLENQAIEKEQSWEKKWKDQEREKEMLKESNNTLKEELDSKIMKIETLTAEKNQIKQQVAELSEEIEKQRTTFSFAEKNFEVNYQELKEEYTCLIEAKTRLEERTLKETLEFEAKLASLQSQIQELEESSRDIKMEEMHTDSKAVVEKDTTELMEKLNVTLSEKESLAGRLCEVTEQLMVTESKVGRLEEDVMRVRQENTKVIAQNESLGKELKKKEEIIRKQTRGQDAQRKAKLEQGEQAVESVASVCSFEDHHLQIQSLQGEIQALQSLLKAAETERDSIQQTVELQRLSHTPSPAAAVQSSGEVPVEGRSSPHKSTASGSSRRKRRQRSKQEHKLGTALPDSKEERQREEEEEAAVEEERATSAAEQEMQPQMERQVMSCSQERAGKEDSTDEYQGDEARDDINKQVSRHGTGRHTEPVVCGGAEEEGATTEHGECRLQMEAQRISLSQIHAAQLELLQEETDTCAHTLELKQQNVKDHCDQDEPKISRYQNMLQAVSQECSAIIQSFRKIFGEEFLEHLDVDVRPPTSVERPETSETTSTVLEAKVLYRDLQQMKEKIEQEHHRLSQLQDVLRADGNKMIELQTAFDELRSSSEKEISELRVQVASLSLSSKDPEKRGAAPSTSPSKELQMLRAEAQEKQLQLEESHRQEIEHLRAHYQQQATETEERYATELFMLQQRLQEVTDIQTHYSLASVPESSTEKNEELSEELKDLDVEELSEGGVELNWPPRSSGLTAQLQVLRKALYHKYVQEVAALKEQHSSELRRLREEKEQERKREDRGEEKETGINGAGSSFDSSDVTGQFVLEEKQHWERVEEEVAKAIVQMSVEFAQQTELARLNKRAGQTNTSMQTRSDEEEVEERKNEEQTPRVSPTMGAWLKEVERERLERELEERNAEIQKLKEKLLKNESGPERALKKREDGQEKDEDEEDRRGAGIKQTGVHRLSAKDDEDSSDKDTERNLLRMANEKLSQVLVDVLKTTAAAEETIGLHMQSLRDACSGGQQAAPPPSTTQRETWQPVRSYTAGHSAESCQGSETGADDVSTWSGETDADEGLEVSQQLMDSLLQGAGTQLENEEYLMGISRRLQTALEKMLMAITDTTNKLEHARMTHTELMRESFRHNQEMTELLQKQEELQERLSEEARAREQLALELHRAEGLIDGYTGERAALEEQLRQKEELQLSLEQELQVTGSRLHELEQERLQMQEERELLSRQQDAMREHAGPRELRLVEAAMVAAPEADLLEETEKLMKEKVEVQRQAEKENADLLKQVKLLEAELEEQVNRVIELEHAQRTENGDLQQQIQALEKQLDKNRRFLDEQAVDREHERDFFQQEIQKLEEQLKNPQKFQAVSEQKNKEVDQLTSQLKEKADWCSELLLSSEQLRRELGERDEEIDKLESRIRELEQALLASAESLEKVEQKKQNESITEAKHSTLEAQLQTEREALERKEKEICNLEEQLEQFREELENKSEEVQQLHMQLEIQRKEISSQQQYLETRDSMLQEIDERDELIKDHESQVECLRSEQERLKRNNEEELDQLNAVIDKLQQELANIEQKQTTEEDEDTQAEPESGVWGPSKEEYDEMKQRMDMAAKELDTLKTEHSKLLETYMHLKESAQALAQTEKLESPEDELEEALREKTAGLVVMQAQVQALEQSATSRVEELGLRIRDLENLVGEKDSELSRCRLVVEQARSDADRLQQKVSNLEENLREKMATVLVSQATLEAFQQQQQQQQSGISKEHQALQRHVEPQAHDLGDFGIPQMDFSGLAQLKQVPTGKVVHLTQKLHELEVGLSGMQKDQELQKQLLSSSEEEVLEYERRLSVLMDLLNQMKARTHQKTSPAVKAHSAADQPTESELLQELQEVRDEAAATKEQLNNYKEGCSKLQEELTEKTETLERLQDQLQRESSGGDEEAKVSKLQRELTSAQNEASATKEELNSCKEGLEKLQELLQEREMTIAHLKGELFQVKADQDRANMTELLKELQEVRNDADSSKEELNSYRQNNEKLQEDIQVREVSISKLKEDLQEVKKNVGTTKEELNGFRQHNEKLQEELNVRELSISKLKEELQEVRAALMKTADSSPQSPSPSLSPQPVSSTSSSSTAQPKRKGGKQPAGKGSSAKDKPSLSRKNSNATSSQSSNKSHSTRLNSSSEQQHVAVTDSFTQTEALQMADSESPSADNKEEMEEVIGEFQEKIVQMQELHAAEILDMEARHISESDTLRRDTQALEDECKALKAVIEKLRLTEVPSSRQDRPASQFKDGYTSDSSSDYSQRTGYDLPSLHQEFRTTPEGARRETDDPLPDRIKTLLREVHQEGMQVLSLSEFPLPEGEPSSQFNVQGWVKERDALLATIASLKDLITQIQTHRGTQTSGNADWHGQLLDAVQKVFMRERSVLKNALYSQLDLLDTSDAIIHLNQLERRLAEQDAQHREAMGSLHFADRSSLMSEIHQLRGQLEQLHQGAQSAVSLAGERSVKEQREGGGADGAAEADRLLVEELKAELSQTKLELETTLKSQHKHLKELDTLRAEVSQKAAQVDALNDQLSEERKKSRDLQWAMEKEKCRTERNQDSKREEVEDLHLTLEEQKRCVSQLTSALELERQTSFQFSQQAEQEALSFNRRLQELQVQLETERAKAQEMSTTLGRERELRRRVSSDSGPSNEQREEEDQRGLMEEGNLLERLQRELDDKHAQVVHLLSQVEAQKLEVVRKEEELTLTGQSSRRDQEALLETRAKLENLEAQMSETQEQLERELERRKSLEEEKERLEEKLARLGEHREGESEGSGLVQGDGRNAVCQSESTNRTKDWVFQQKSSSSGTSPHPEVSSTGHGSGLHHGPWRTVDKILGKLHLVSSKIRSMASKNTGRLTAEIDSEELSLVQSTVDEVITLLQQSPGLPSVPESTSLLAGGSSSSSNSLTERLLRQNVELTGFVSRLTEEKNDLRNHTLRLEEELRRYRQAGLGSGDGSSSRRGVSKLDSAGMLVSQEREAWTREKVRMEKALHLAQAQVARLRGEIRTDTLQEITGPEADNAALKRMYGKYLRSESFRKALIYQKKYLLLLLGGFQECEEATLSLLSRMGSRPSLSSLESLSQRRRGLMRFRSAVRVSIALSRMRFLVKRWHKATGMSSTISCSVNKNGGGQTLGTDVRESPYLHPGNVDMYRERGGVGVGGGGGGGGGGGVSSSRGRSGRESPRSAVSSTQHRFHMAGDHGALTCSHLQSYDPDRALTDYISRLEALQRRLGSVTSGASSYAQLHFGLRR
ncbi:A-kinase anchor protein 9 isoform X2 [Scomber scombrus]|uniref:A-kinase anchor protein 9 isoform X2 n=1 Tax=Scomber scombrus TaxID=13677 RepID=UPI002DDB40A5|nr:A-kinase anchor protein 9 isoform X2 [Scomber scombrus]